MLYIYQNTISTHKKYPCGGALSPLNKVCNMSLTNSSAKLKDKKICWIARRYVGWLVKAPAYIKKEKSHQPLSDGKIITPVKFAPSPCLMGNESLCSFC